MCPSCEGSLIRVVPSTHRWIIGMFILVCQQSSRVQMLLNISMAMYPRKWIVSLASWQPRWVAKVFPQEQKLEGPRADKADKTCSISVHQLLFQTIQRFCRLAQGFLKLRKAKYDVNASPPEFLLKSPPKRPRCSIQLCQQNSVCLGSPLISSSWSSAVLWFGRLHFKAFLLPFIAQGFIHTNWCSSLSIWSSICLAMPTSCAMATDLPTVCSRFLKLSLYPKHFVANMQNKNKITNERIYQQCRTRRCRKFQKVSSTLHCLTKKLPKRQASKKISPYRRKFRSLTSDNM